MLEAEARGRSPVRSAGRPPHKGDRIEFILPGLAEYPRGTVWHVDAAQILVKWDDGRSESLRPNSADRFRIIEDE
jgi:hypothetical protein